MLKNRLSGRVACAGSARRLPLSLLSVFFRFPFSPLWGGTTLPPSASGLRPGFWAVGTGVGARPRWRPSGGEGESIWTLLRFVGAE